MSHRGQSHLKTITRARPVSLKPPIQHLLCIGAWGACTRRLFWRLFLAPHRSSWDWMGWDIWLSQVIGPLRAPWVLITYISRHIPSKLSKDPSNLSVDPLGSCRPTPWPPGILQAYLLTPWHPVGPFLDHYCPLHLADLSSPVWSCLGIGSQVYHFGLSLVCYGWFDT